MINAPASESPEGDAVSTRLTGIEERLDEIIRQLDKMKHLVRMLDDVWHTPVGDESDETCGEPQSSARTPNN